MLNFLAGAAVLFIGIFFGVGIGIEISENMQDHERIN